MIFTTLYSIFFALFAALSVHAAVVQRDVWVPAITSPASGVQLKVGQPFTVSWDISKAPTQITNPIGVIYLRAGSSTMPLILAGNFPLKAGSVKVTIPWVMNRTDYSFVLMGDSGNWSPAFSITGPSPY